MNGSPSDLFTVISINDDHERLLEVVTRAELEKRLGDDFYGVDVEIQQPGTVGFVTEMAGLCILAGRPVQPASRRVVTSWELP